MGFDGLTRITSSVFVFLWFLKNKKICLDADHRHNLVHKRPNLVRSEFARFDPEFRHLKNLSAAVGIAPAGLLTLQEVQKRANEEQQRQGLLQ